MIRPLAMALCFVITSKASADVFVAEEAGVIITNGRIIDLQFARSADTGGPSYTILIDHQERIYLCEITTDKLQTLQSCLDSNSNRQMHGGPFDGAVVQKPD